MSQVYISDSSTESLLSCTKITFGKWTNAGLLLYEVNSYPGNNAKLVYSEASPILFNGAYFLSGKFFRIEPQTSSFPHWSYEKQIYKGSKYLTCLVRFMFYTSNYIAVFYGWMTSSQFSRLLSKDIIGIYSAFQLTMQIFNTS